LGSPPLEGVFEANPFPGAPNGSLWTLRYEILMYAILAISGRFIPQSMLKHLCPLAVVVFGTIWIVVTVGHLTPVKIPFVWRLQTEFYGERIAYLGAFFFAGATMHVHFERIPLSGWFACALGIALLTVSNDLLAMTLLWVALPYMAIVFAYKAPAPFRKTNGLDYSYGIYIYAFPVQQSVSLIGAQQELPWISVLLISAAITLLLAGLSWHFIEKPALSLKNLLLQKPGSVTSALVAE